MKDQKKSKVYFPYVAITIFFFIFCQAVGVSFSQPAKDAENPKVLVKQLKKLLRQKIEKGEDVSKIIDLDKRSKDAIMSGDQEEGIRLLKEALEIAREGGDYKKRPKKVTRKKDDTFKLDKKSNLKNFQKTIKVELSIPADEVIYTVAVPKSEFERGCQINDFGKAFESKILKVRDGKLSLQLDNRPVFLEVESNESKENQCIDRQASPFGIHGVSNYSDELVESGCPWVRFDSRPLGATWDMIESQQGVFNWHLHDRVYAEMYRAGINMIPVIKSINRWDRGIENLKTRPKFRYPNNIESYGQFVTKLVERYDGDGYKDAPGSPVVQYWQVENEVDLHWKDTPEHYAELLKNAYLPIIKANPKAKVVMGAIANIRGLDFFESILKHLNVIKDNPNDRFFDAVDIHWAGDAKGYAVRRKLRSKHSSEIITVSLEQYIGKVNKLLAKYGYSDVSIWINEISTHSGTPVTRHGGALKNQTEEEQAIGLLKLFVYPLSLGVERSFWVTLYEWHGFGGVKNQYYDHVGLIHNPKNTGLEGKKLSFYTFKHLIEKTAGADWKTIKQIDSGVKHVCLFRVMIKGNPFYILWRDNNF